LEQEGLFLSPFYNDWVDWRDGMRDWYRDYKLIKNVVRKRWNQDLVAERETRNKKQKRLLRRRKRKKFVARFGLAQGVIAGRVPGWGSLFRDPP